MLIVINSYIIMKDKDNDNNDKNNAQNKDNKKCWKKVEFMWMIIFNNSKYNNNK